MITRHVTLLMALALTFVSPANAWNARGHMMIATVAWDRLSPNARSKASALIKLNPHYSKWTEGVADADRDLVAFIKASVWADEIRGEAGYANGPEDASPPAIGYADKSRHSEWHYKNLAFSPDGTPIKTSPESNALSQIHRMTAQLRNPNVSAEARSYDLVWLLHLVGDVHQPLHATSRYTAEIPDGDRGGNEVSVCPTACGDQPRSLHSFWDGLMGSGSDPRDAIDRARRLAAPASDTAGVTSPDAWLQESLELAKAAAYASPIGLGAGPYVLSEKYKQRAGGVAEERIAHAGVRLAAVLEEALVD